MEQFYSPFQLRLYFASLQLSYRVPQGGGRGEVFHGQGGAFRCPGAGRATHQYLQVREKQGGRDLLEMPHLFVMQSIIIKIELKMEPLNPPSLPLLKPLDPQLLQEIQYSETTLQAHAQLSHNDPNKYELALIEDIVILSLRGKSATLPLGHARLDSSLKFERIFQTEGVGRRKLQGFRLVNDFGEAISFLIQFQNLANLWADQLAKLINQLGFHSQYKPVRTLGKGSFATVYEIVRLEDGRRFAAKVFAKDSIKDNRNKMNSFINELEILRYIDHKNLLKLESVFETDHSYYVITETLNGGNLFEYLIKRRTGLSVEEVRRIMRSLLQGLAELQGNGIVHRDIKLENLMLKEKEGIEPVIVDFGLAVFEDDEDYIYYQCGTPGYLAPEVLALTRGQKLCSRSDVFAAGVVMHVLLMGRYLFEGKTPREVLDSNKAMSFDLSKEEYSRLHPDLFDLLAKMLQKDVQLRPSASECLDHPALLSPPEQKYAITPLTTSNSDSPF